LRARRQFVLRQARRLLAVLLQSLYGDVARCKERDTLWCEPALSQEEIAGTPESFDACSDAVDAQSCDDFNANVAPEACKIKPGPLALGQACRTGWQCQSLHCKAPANSTCPVCTAKSAVGGACASNSDCESGSRCRQQTCVPEVGDGATCGGTTGVCKYSSICSNSICTKLLPVGAACDPALDVCDRLTFGAVCDPQSNTCKALIKLAAAGQPCGALPDAETGCEAFGACSLTSPDGLTGTCVGPVADGAPCDPSGVACNWPAVCWEGTCQLSLVSQPAGCSKP